MPESVFELRPPEPIEGLARRLQTPSPEQREISFTVYGIPQSKGSTKAFVPKGWTRPILTSTNRNVKGWETAVRTQAQALAGGTFFQGAVVLAIDFVLPRPSSLPKRVVNHSKKPDCSKLVRAAEDALIGVLFKDDAQITTIVARKLYAPEGQPPHAVVRVIGDVE